MRIDDYVAAIRKRPGMYVGGTGSEGLYHLIYMLLDAVLLDSRARCDRIAIELSRDRSCTLVFSMRPPSRARILEALTAPKDQELHWVTVSALASSFEAQGRSGNDRWRIATRKGELLDDAKPQWQARAGDVRRGLHIRFVPDRGTFKSVNRFDPHMVALRLRELAYLFSGLETEVVDRRSGHVERRRHPDGLAALVAELTEARGVPSEIIQVEHRCLGVRVRVALRWNGAVHGEELQPMPMKPVIWSFANTVRTRGGGRHVSGFVRSLAAAVHAVSPAQEISYPSPARAYSALPISRNALLRGLTAAIAVDGPRSKIEFLGPTKSTLGIDGLDDAIAEGLGPKLEAELNHRKTEVSELFEQMREYDRATLAG